MKTIIRILFCLLAVDFFYFSSKFTFTAGLNTKQIMAVIGIALFIFNSIKNGGLKVSRGMIILLLLAAGVSLASYLSMVFNNTTDKAYLSYAISMLVWLAGAYTMVEALRFAYGKISVELVANYIIVVSVIQCAISLAAQFYTPVNHFIKSIVYGTDWLDEVNRWYGLGDATTLDTAGIRYSIACVLCAHMVVSRKNGHKALVPLYLLAMAFIITVGNIVARTTTVGTLLALAYLFVHSFSGIRFSRARLRTIGWMSVVFALAFTVFAWFYNTNSLFHRNLRFGFEGFFSLVEHGKWNTASNNKLLTMYVYPDNPKTWIIGDGYFRNPYFTDPNFMGDLVEGFYMGTDVGYLRFIFYFGLIGLIFFAAMILHAGGMCFLRFRDDRVLFVLLTLINFIVWFKVATDCFFILAIFIALYYIRDYELKTPLIESPE